MIPFFDYVVTTDNYDKVESFENISIKITKNDNNVNIYFKNTFPSNFFYYKDNNGKMYLSLIEKKLAQYLKDNNICNVTHNQDYDDWVDMKKNDKLHWSTGLLKVNVYNEIQRIYKLWENIIIYPDCSFDVNYVKDTEIATIPIRESGDILKTWIIKYKEIFNSISPNNFIFELSAGLDSRAFSYFWKDNPKYRLYSKNDDLELPIVKNLLKYMNVSNELLTSKKGVKGITVSGIGNSSKSFNDRDIFEHYAGIHHSKHLIKDVCPYLDRDFLKIYGDYPQQVKLVVQLLLVPQYISIPYITWINRKFNFTTNKIREIRTIIDKWLKIDMNNL